MNRYVIGTVLTSIFMLSLLLSSYKKSITNGEEDFFEHRPPLITVFLVPMDGMSATVTEEAQKIKGFSINWKYIPQF